MAAYAILELTIHDPEQLKGYKKVAPAIIKAFEGEIIARESEVITLEGDWNPERIVMIKFPSMAQARAWEASESYQKAKELRALAAQTRVVLVNGVE